ncbi:MAG: HIRAN domain-containing protein [Eggerthellaceae bacterium]|nr:HIRAN domain-containing protein [Eggerthellaceae bacterium]
MDNVTTDGAAPNNAPSTDEGRDWLATTGAGSAGAVLAALRDPSLGVGAPFSQPILLFERARVAGTTNIRDIDFICEDIEPGAKLGLKRDADNRDDAFAVRVFSPKNELIGYVPADINEPIARLLDAGKHLYAVMTDHERYHAWNKVYFEVYLDD